MAAVSSSGAVSGGVCVSKRAAQKGGVTTIINDSPGPDETCSRYFQASQVVDENKSRNIRLIKSVETRVEKSILNSSSLGRRPKDTPATNEHDEKRTD